MKYSEIFNKAITKMVEDINFELNIRELFPDLSPSDVEEILGELGWQLEFFEPDDLAQDIWCSLHNKNYPFDLIMYYNGFYWSLTLYRSDRK